MRPPKRIKVFLAVPTTGEVADSQEYFLREMKQTYEEYVEFIYPKVCVRRIFHDFARNALVEEFLESDADVLWFLDSDITPNRHVLDLIAMHWDKWQIAGAPYPVFMEPNLGEGLQVVYTVYRTSAGGGLQPGNVPREGTDFVEGLATGCLFIKREVLEGMSKPYFEFKYDAETRRLIEGEDLGFCLKMREKGIKFFTDYGMVCRHTKKIDLLDVNNYAIMYANNQLMAYETEVKRLAAEMRAKQLAAKKAEQAKPKIWMPT